MIRGWVLNTEPSVAFTLVQHATTKLHFTAAHLVTELPFGCRFPKVTELLYFSNLLDIQSGFHTTRICEVWADVHIFMATA